MAPGVTVVRLDGCPACDGKERELAPAWVCQRCGFWQVDRGNGVILSGDTARTLPAPDTKEGYVLVCPQDALQLP